MAYFFDLDGTLLNTLDDIGHTGNAVLAARGYPQHPLPAYRMMVGLGFKWLLRQALPQPMVEEMAAKRPEELDSLLEQMVMEAREWYAAHLHDCTVPYPGIHSALRRIAGQGQVMAVLSNKPEVLTVPLIQHFFPDIGFAQIRGGRAGVPLKPDPEAVGAMLGELDLQSDKCYYVGDSVVDILTAKNAGMVSVGVAWGFRGLPELEKAGADILLESPEQLAELPEL